ncbi:hypothetical protein [Subtercola vilae]|uniref:Phage tail protein n=1 Tax=Subtercola vilae TaxID=2056433 RepID=A0A4T2BRX5_9MICO|nr:hypothetical protein [Subtercola vilae]TIH33672.1 hypothetical protein D4765_14410 [Subtercola vilae]
MAHDSLGPKNEPQYAGTGIPADAADLTELGAFAALMGNSMAGTHAQRVALTVTWVGLEFRETDTANQPTYRMTSSGWQIASILIGSKSWKYLRVGSATDTFAAGSATALIAGTLTGAAAGQYLVGCNLSLFGSAQSEGNLRLIASSTNLSADMQAGVNLVSGNIDYVSPFTWTGGDLAFTVSYILAAGTGSINKNGSSIWATYVGP